MVNKNSNQSKEYINKTIINRYYETKKLNISSKKILKE